MITMINLDATLGNRRVWLGYQRMMDAITKGEALSDVLLGLARHYKTSEAVNFDLFNGALMCLLDSWASMVGAGVTVTGEDKRVENFMNGSRIRMLCDVERAEQSDPGLFAAFIHALCYGVHNTRKSIRFVVTTPAPVADKVLSVLLVSEPERITTQTVQRDSNMEIVSTTTRTFDAVS